MQAKVSLSVVDGPTAGEKFEFTERSVAIAGRAVDCTPRIIEESSKPIVSRHHCLFDINPPDVRVRDFGSLNGTSVNDVEIGRRKQGQTPEEAAKDTFPEQDLHHGDVVKVGNTTLRIDIDVPTIRAAENRCANCDRLVPAVDARGGEVVCEHCRATPEEVLDSVMLDSGTEVAIGGFDFIRELGRGGQGRVYLVRDKSTREQLALKMLLAEVSVDGRARDDFLREISNVQILHHRNIVEYRNAYYMNGAFFFTTEFCDGGSVHDLVLKRGTPLPADQAVPIIVDALRGLAYAHEVFVGADASGLVHRDIKPANILLAGSGSEQVAKIGDFGLAKAFDRAGLSGHSSTGTAAGTFPFMARKQLINFKYSKPDVDVWSMAASLYWMLTGKAPRTVPPGSDPILAVLNEKPVPMRDRDPRVDRRLADVVDAALVDKPEAELTTAAGFSAALTQAM